MISFNITDPDPDPKNSCWDQNFQSVFVAPREPPQVPRHNELPHVIVENGEAHYVLTSNNHSNSNTNSIAVELPPQPIPRVRGGGEAFQCISLIGIIFFGVLGVGLSILIFPIGIPILIIAGIIYCCWVKPAFLDSWWGGLGYKRTTGLEFYRANFVLL